MVWCLGRYRSYNIYTERHFSKYICYFKDIVWMVL
ncbi:MAG: BA14K family protein [Treponema sp.]|nr:BA14K family protein [Treponema sp.]